MHNKWTSCTAVLQNQTWLVTQIKCLLYVKRNRKKAQPFLSVQPFNLVLLCYFFLLFQFWNCKIYQYFQPKSWRQSLPPSTPNKIMVWFSQPPNIILTFCLHAAFRSEELGSQLHIFLEIKMRTVQVFCSFLCCF